jgi:hypothetical protein
MFEDAHFLPPEVLRENGRTIYQRLSILRYAMINLFENKDDHFFVLDADREIFAKKLLAVADAFQKDEKYTESKAVVFNQAVREVLLGFTEAAQEENDVIAAAMALFYLFPNEMTTAVSNVVLQFPIEPVIQAQSESADDLNTPSE